MFEDMWVEKCFLYAWVDESLWKEHEIKWFVCEIAKTQSLYDTKHKHVYGK
jgi:hypothetical protein